MIDLALAVEEAYWSYLNAIENLKVATQALEQAEDLLDINKTRFDVGKAAAIDVLIAETGVATNRELHVVAEAAVAQGRDRLLRLITPRRALAEWDVDVVPLDRPPPYEGVIDVESTYRRALDQRPDYREAVLAVESKEIEVRKAKNDRLPKLDFLGSIDVPGLGSTPDNSYDALASGRFYEYFVGFAFELPIPNRTLEAALTERELEAEQLRARVYSLEQNIIFEVRTAAREIETARERIRASETARRLAERQLENERERLRVGLVTSHDVFIVEGQLTAARFREQQAIIDLEIARARLRRIEATTLDALDITVE